ncbi:MAG: efflux RND transporter periplasmic adaptor subunit [Dokdonella sp.]|uniref:HlyD family secretion protein n=1 Tax=Dokdonella sp. TaxID=2291710 RepID=UPI0025BDED2C|nr:HlyD family efflux transporter periplasmic adaptor subunit [Dokdonella sp.]MBX3700621.1 efflux RND transporter periplasmic adaptor subunit [Dokdonella sp.]MCW5578048.1 efflux RND transporter periplasmic adaptor subunit [Dokdonella sp.]
MSDSPTAATGDNGKRRALLLLIGLVFVLAGLAWYLAWRLVFSQREVTDDAYVNGNQVIVSAQIPGTVVAILADDTQRVEAGQVLARLDPTDTELALAKASSALAHAVRQVRQLGESAAQADVAIAARRLDLARAQADLARRTPLLADKAVAAEEVAHLRDGVELARSALDAAQRQAAAAHALIDGSDVAGNPAVLQARAAFREAWVNARRNAILAPISGYVAQRNVQVGNRVQPGQPLLTVIPLHDLWIDANFKESQLANIRIGQPAHVESDVYGGKVEYTGKVVGLGAGTGSAFALLPPQNASGNWIKVVQRVPVRIALDAAQLERHPLRIGLSTTVKIDTHERNGRMLAPPAGEAMVAQTDVYARDLAKADAEADAIITANLPTTH